MAINKISLEVSGIFVKWPIIKSQTRTNKIEARMGVDISGEKEL